MLQHYIKIGAFAAAVASAALGCFGSNALEQRIAGAPTYDSIETTPLVAEAEKEAQRLGTFLGVGASNWEDVIARTTDAQAKAKNDYVSRITEHRTGSEQLTFGDSTTATTRCLEYLIGPKAKLATVCVAFYDPPAQPYGAPESFTLRTRCDVPSFQGEYLWEVACIEDTPQAVCGREAFGCVGIGVSTFNDSVAAFEDSKLSAQTNFDEQCRGAPTKIDVDNQAQEYAHDFTFTGGGARTFRPTPINYRGQIVTVAVAYSADTDTTATSKKYDACMSRFK